jgi:hypothetical protein
MRDPIRLTNIIVLAGTLALVGCASAGREYANSHGYYPARINGKKYYCTPRPLILGMNPSTTVNCLSPADIENVRTGKELPPAPAPATASDLPNGFRRVLINDQQMFCWNTYTTETVTWSWCDFSLAVAQARERAAAARGQVWNRVPNKGIWADYMYPAFP